MSATSDAVTPIAAKPCQGTALAPIRMADAATASTQKSFLSRATGGYVPPSMRKTPSYPDTPTSVTSLNTSSREEFPTLGSTPKSAISGAASWTQIRTRFHPEPSGTSTPASTPAPSTDSPVATSTNQFAALGDDVETPVSSSSKTTNFKRVIEERIKREEAQRLGLYEAEPTDPQKMTHEQLARNGWAVIPLPPSQHGDARKAWFADFRARQAEQELVRKAREEMDELMGGAFYASPMPAAPTSRDDVFDDDDDTVSVDHPEDDGDESE